MEVYIDGKFHPAEEARISVWDHGLLYGDGVFEGIRVYGDRVFRLDEHLKRLYDSARSIALKIPLSRHELKGVTLECCRRNKMSDGYIRIVVTRGRGDLGIDPRKCARATLIVIVDNISLFPAESYDKGVRVVTAATRKHAPATLSPRIKSLNYLNNIMAKLEAIHAGVSEAVMLNAEGYVTEGTGDNIFIMSEGILKTPPVFVGLLDGVTRNVVLKLAEELGIPTEEAKLTMHDLYTADEVFLTGTAAELVPVVEIDGRPIGEGKPGSIYARLRDAFKKLTSLEGDFILEGEHLSVS
ncbi:MAG: branched-chain-amino-acid transaminase [bacterium]